jgi:L-cysteine:1D-myo-inositol 2-amino-2-deoxy-alpha-D-glucopyranoside ligase
MSQRRRYAPTAWEDTLELYNELSRSVETFRPLTGTATIYVCGITPYDTTHLGHAFTYLSFDVLIRYLEYQGYPVRYVQNVTDIDDDILRKGKEVGEDWLALGNRWTRHFIEDLKRLNVRPPDVYPRATDVVPQMFEAIQTLIANGHAYEANGNVYYDVASDPDFGKVSGLAPDEWLPIANERGNVPDDPNKRAPLDFVLWQAAKPGEPVWQSPWGPGRPGWHIECSTMAKTYLGEIIDVHGGGSDLQFPHHECETAQACGVTGQDVFARFWMHSAMVRYQGEKMSKSLGNLVWARDLMNQYNEDTVRILLSRHPYHQVWEYDAAELAPTQAMAQRLLEALAAPGGSGVPVPVARYVSEFEAAMDDNLATDRALAVLDGMARDIQHAAAAERDLSVAQATLRRLCAVFGLRLDGDIEPRVQQGWDLHYQRFV